VQKCSHIIQASSGNHNFAITFVNKPCSKERAISLPLSVAGATSHELPAHKVTIASAVS